MNYIINKYTNYLVNKNKIIEIIENNKNIIIKDSNILKIIEDNCIYYGSSYKGRIEAAKNIINSRYKLPIIISEKKELLFFKINNIEEEKEYWFNYKNIISYIKKKEGILIKFINNKEEIINISYSIFNNQMLKCSRLWLVYLNR